MAIEWDEHLMTTGSFNIDSEHKEWLRRFNEFEDTVESRKDMATIDKALARFAQFSHTHFPHEEAMMDQYNCPAADANRTDHQKFREKLTQLQLSISAHEEVNLEQILYLKKDLENWLRAHISTIDVQLRPILAIEHKPPFIQQASKGTAPFFVGNTAPEKLSKTAPLGSFAEVVLQNSPDVIVIVDDQGKIVYANGRCLPLLGYEPKELLGQNVDILVPGQFIRHKELREGYLRKPTVRAMGHRPILSALHKSGAKVPVDISLSPLPAIDGRVRLIQAVLRDAMPLWASQYDLLVQSVAMNAATNGVLITDLKGIIQWANPAITRMTGYSISELIGRTPSILSSGQHDPSFYKGMWDTILAGETWFGEIINRRKDGTLYYEEQSITPVRFEDGQIKRFVAIKQDTTARRQAERELQEANGVLQKHLAEVEHLATLLGESNKGLEEKVQARTHEFESVNAALLSANQQLMELDDLKSSFLGVISHELRTPFVSIIFSLQLIEKYGLGSLQPEQQAQFLQLQSNIKSAEGMIENLINYATFVSKQGQLNLAPVSISKVVATALIPSGYKANRKQIILKEHLPADLPLVLGDEKRLTEAVYQLVDNAIKFANPGTEVTISAWLKENSIIVSVNNIGQNIPSDKLFILWKSFAQMADPHLRSREGLGLGLALVEYIVRAHHGEVWAESQVDNGNTFGFRLPCDPV